MCERVPFDSRLTLGHYLLAQGRCQLIARSRRTHYEYRRKSSKEQAYLLYLIQTLAHRKNNARH
nr:MAG TPA: hypothetical protein [Caudoviricetes sp.]